MYHEIEVVLAMLRKAIKKTDITDEVIPEEVIIRLKACWSDLKWAQDLLSDLNEECPDD